MIYILLNFLKKLNFQIGIKMHAFCGTLSKYWLRITRGLGFDVLPTSLFLRKIITWKNL